MVLLCNCDKNDENPQKMTSKIDKLIGIFNMCGYEWIFNYETGEIDSTVQIVNDSINIMIPTSLKDKCVKNV